MDTRNYVGCAHWGGSPGLTDHAGRRNTVLAATGERAGRDDEPVRRGQGNVFAVLVGAAALVLAVAAAETGFLVLAVRCVRP